MKLSVLTTTLLSVLAIPLASAQFTETFDNLDGWSVSSTTTSPTVATYFAPDPYVSDGSLKLISEPHPTDLTQSGTQILRTVTTTANTSLKFSEENDKLVFTISGLDLTQSGGTGNKAYPTLDVGWSTSNITFSNTANNAIYFSLVGTNYTPTIKLKTGAATATLWTGSNGASYDSITITFTTTEWFVNVDGVIASGTHSASWIGTTDLYAQTRLEAATVRSWVTDVSIDGLSAIAIPEPCTIAAILGLTVISLAFFRHCGRK